MQKNHNSWFYRVSDYQKIENPVGCLFRHGEIIDENGNTLDDNSIYPYYHLNNHVYTRSTVPSLYTDYWIRVYSILDKSIALNT